MLYLRSFNRFILVSLALLGFSLSSADAATVFSTSSVVTSTDRNATFDSLISNGIDLTSYSEDSLFVTVGVPTFQGNTAFSSGDSRTTAFHYGSTGSLDYVSIRGTDGAIFTALDFLMGDGQTGDTTNLQWQTYLDGVLVGSATESSLLKGFVYGWTDAGGFDELRVAAAHTETNPGFGLHQAIAIDDLRAQVSVVPVPAAAWLFGTALIGLIGLGRRKSKVTV